MNGTNSPPKADNLARWVSWLVLIAFTALSCYLNAEYARAHGDAVNYHVALPLLALTAGLYAEIIYLSQVRRTVRWVTGVLVGVGFIVVMIASYISIRGVVYVQYTTFPGWLNDAIAAFPDGFMIIAATVLLAHRWTRVKGMATAAAKPFTPSPAKQILGNYTRRWVEHSEGKEAQAEPLVEVRETFTAPSLNARVEGAEPSAAPAVEVAKPSPKPSSKPPVKVRKQSVEPSVDETLIPFMDAAGHMVETSVVARKTAAELAQVIAAVEAGKSPNAIKSELGISPSTTAKVSAAWAEWRREHRLVAV
ncbi:hypothetical protein [Mycolicibacterium fallax]|uniref:hypothetical protein n=1 Tax=Mycolicibacterium fallax TaxID=1793 RepID=UPI001055A926|nr:hypothetical protein [Mycolicibacterium fallax]MCB1256480.1 hypothetical protein [Microthrixaceae bacterium]BBY98368.1 hypothetical protein MFAL_18350 [Mycolicibacterium fallax]